MHTRTFYIYYLRITVLCQQIRFNFSTLNNYLTSTNILDLKLLTSFNLLSDH